MFPLTLVISDDGAKVKLLQVPTISEWDHDLGVAWFIPKRDYST